jgi:hypothetical protein
VLGVRVSAERPPYLLSTSRRTTMGLPRRLVRVGVRVRVRVSVRVRAKVMASARVRRAGSGYHAVRRASMHFSELRYCVVSTTMNVDAPCTC